MFDIMMSLCVVLATLAFRGAAGSTMLRSTSRLASADNCSGQSFCEVDSTDYPNMLPMGDVPVVSYSFDDSGDWYIAGKENGVGKLWRVSCDLQSYKVVVEKNFSDIESSHDGSEVYGIADGAVYAVLATNPNEYLEIAPADSTRDYTGVAFDSDHRVLYVTGKASSSVYAFVKNGSSWKEIPGYTNDALENPTSIRYLGGYVYVRVSDGVARLRFGAGKDQTPMMYTGLGISGDEDFTVAPDNYLYYRHGDDAVYRKPLDDPTAQGELYAGGCGCGMNDNQVCTAGYGNLVYYTPDGSSSGQLVMQDYNDEVNFRFLGFCPCEPSTTTTTSHTTAGVGTTTATTEQSTTTRTEPTTSEIKTTSSSTTEPLTATQTSAAVTSTTTMTTPAQCGPDFCEVDSIDYPNMLPMGDVSVVSYSFDDFGDWYIAGKENGVGKLWRVSCDLQSYKVVAEKNFSDIESSHDGSEVYGIADGAVYAVLATNPNEYLEIAPADSTRDYTGVAFDSDHRVLYVTGEASSSVYAFVKNGSSWKEIPGYTNDALENSTSIRYLGGYVYVRVSDGVARLRLGAGKDQTPMMYTGLGISGDEDFTVAPDNYLYYRHGGDAVYRKPLDDPTAQGELYAGGCGCGMNDNQVCTAGYGNLVYYTPDGSSSGQLVMQDYNDEVNFRFLGFCPCKPSTTTTTSHTTAGVETTTATTEQSTTTRTEPTTSEIKTTSASTTEPLTATQTSAAVTSTTTMTTPGQCGPDFCEVDSIDYPNMLPMGDVSVVSYSLDDFGDWYIAGKENGVGKLWRVSCDLQSYKVVVEKNFSDIESSHDGSEVYGIADGAVYAVLATNPNEYLEIAPADSTRDYTGVAFDSDHRVLYVTGKASSSVYAFVKNGSSWKEIPGYTNDALENPTSIRYLGGYVYVRVSDGVARLRFGSGKDQTPMMYTGLGISGDEDFTVAPDNYLYYRHGGDAVYRKPLDDPTAQGELYAGGCGCGMNDYQVCTAGYGNLVYYTPDGSSSGQLVMQDYNDEVNFRFLGFCPCKPSTTTTTSHTTAGVETTTATTEQSTTTRTEPTTSEIKTTSASTTEPLTATQTSAAVTSTTTMTTPGQCGPDFCEVDSTDYPNMLPMGDVSVVSYSFDDFGDWYVAGKENGVGKLWRVSCDLQSYKVVVEKNFSDIESSHDGSEVYGIADGAVYAVLATNPNEYLEIAPADSTRDYTGVAFDSDHRVLYVTGKASSSVYAFVKNGSSWKEIPGYTNDALENPTSIRYLGGYVYVRVSDGVARLRFGAGKDQTPMMYTGLGISGDEDFTVAPDNYLYYRHGGDAVYRKPLDDPTAQGELYAGGCGCGMNDNQVCTAGYGNLVYYTPDGSSSGQLVMQDYNDEVNFRFLGFCPCKPSTTATTSHTTAGVGTTTATTEQSTTTRTEPTTSEIKTTSASTTEPLTATQTSAAVTSTTTMTTPAQCGPDFCEVDSMDYPNMLPMGDVSVVSYSLDDFGDWYIAGKENGVGKLWRVSCDLQSYKVVVEKNFSDIESSHDGSEVYGIADGAVYAVLATNPNEYLEIAPADSTRDYTGVAFDSDHRVLYVTGKASSSVYAFVKNGSPWKEIPGYTNDALENSTSIRYLGGYVYVRVSGGVARLRFGAGKDQTPMMYTGLGISGDEDFTVAPDNYLYYRHGGDAVYRKPLDDPTAQGELYAGGCGCGMNDNQVCTAGYGNLVYYTPDGSSSGQIVMQDYNDEVNFRFLGFCPCKPSTTTTTSHTTAGVGTTTATTEQSTTTRTEPTTSEIKTTSASTTEPLTATQKTSTIATTSQATGPVSLQCDAYCGSISPGSYCKYWKIPSVCEGSNKPCSCEE